MRVITDIIVTATGNRQDSKITVSDIDFLHSKLGYKGVGYHYIIYPDGSTKAGRRISSPACCCKGHNAHSVAVAYIGGVDEKGQLADTRTEQQKTAIKNLITRLTFLYRCPTHGVRDHQRNTQNPYFDAYAEYKGILESINANLK